MGSKNPWNKKSIEEFSFICCSKCDFTSKEGITYQYHVAEQHPKLIMIDKTSKNLQIKQEVKIESDELKIESGHGSNFQCDICDEYFTNEENLISHSYIHNDGYQNNFENDPIKDEVETTEWKIEPLDTQLPEVKNDPAEICKKLSQAN